jgi:3-keto-5-aminohexanoate cleavage enzyme
MQGSFENRLIVNFTPTGMVPTKAMSPHVPIAVNEVIEQVHEAVEIGITLAHLHAREAYDGSPSWKADIYGHIFEGIRKFCPELVLCASLSGRNYNVFEKRSEVLSLRPDMGSLTLSSLNFSRQASTNSPDMILQLAAKMLEEGVHAEWEIFDLGMLHYGHYLVRKNLLQPPYYVNIIAGNVAGIQANLSELGIMLSQLPQGAYWAFGGIGNQQLQANTLALASGGGVRIGLEDNLYWDQSRKTLATNAGLLKRIHELAAIFERPLMSPREFGELGFYNRFRQP